MAAHDSLEIAIPEKFVGLHPDREVRIYNRNLPHWRQAGATYFVTFRLADSLPDDVAEELREESNAWRNRLNEFEKRGEPIPEGFKEKWERFHRRHFVKIETGLDRCHGACLFRESKVRKIVSDTLAYFDGDRYLVFASVVMPNHCHLAVRPERDWELQSLLKSWKSFSSRKVNGMLNSSGSIWQSESYDRIIRDEDHFRKVICYLVENPGKARLRRNEYSLFLSESLGIDETDLEVRSTK